MPKELQTLVFLDIKNKWRIITATNGNTFLLMQSVNRLNAAFVAKHGFDKLMNFTIPDFDCEIISS